MCCVRKAMSKSQGKWSEDAKNTMERAERYFGSSNCNTADKSWHRTHKQLERILIAFQVC